MVELVHVSLLHTSQIGTRLRRIFLGSATYGHAMNDLNTECIAREVGVDESVVSDVAARLRLVRGDLTDSGFFSLVRDVVKTKIKFAERDAKEDLSVVRVRQRAD